MSMKYIYIVILAILLSSCSIQFKGKDLELDAKPAEPGVTWSMSEIGFDPFDFIKNGG